MQIISK